MKCIVLYTTLPIVGGNSTITLSLASFFKQCGYEVTVIVRNQNDHGINYVVIENLKQIHCNVFVLSTKSGYSFFQLLFYILKIRFKIDRDKNFISIGMGLMAPLTAFLGGFRIKIYYFITHDVNLTPLRRLGKTIHFFTKVIVISPASLEPFSQKISSMLPCVWLPQFSELNVAYETINRNNDQIVSFGFIGSLKKSKGILLLLNIWDQHMQHAELNILGGGELENQVRSHAESSTNIKYFGSFSPTDRDIVLPNFFQKIDYLIVPSIGDHEGLPTVILEALSFGVSVISTTGGGTIAFNQPILNDDFYDSIRLVSEMDLPDLLANIKIPNIEQRSRARSAYIKWFSNSVLSTKWIEVLK